VKQILGKGCLNFGDLVHLNAGEEEEKKGRHGNKYVSNDSYFPTSLKVFPKSHHQPLRFIVLPFPEKHEFPPNPNLHEDFITFCNDQSVPFKDLKQKIGEKVKKTDSVCFYCPMT
jgi:hypothetical protein